MWAYGSRLASRSAAAAAILANADFDSNGLQRYLTIGPATGSHTLTGDNKLPPNGWTPLPISSIVIKPILIRGD